MEKGSGIKKITDARLLVFDADDTLWENETLFRDAEKTWAGILSDYGTLEELSEELYRTEAKNMDDLGYGAKAYMISILETTLRVTGGRVTGEQTGKILDTLPVILHNPSTPYPGVRESLEILHSDGRFKLVLLTKGDLLDQEHKIERSALGDFFDKIEVVSGKSTREYERLCSQTGIPPSQAVSIGNSLKSDIHPMLELGGWGIHVPSKELWVHEKTGEYDHPRLLKVNAFKDILSYLI